MMITAALLSMCMNSVVEHEGFRHNAYKDNHGYSIGHGYSLTHNPLHLSKKELSNFKRNGISEERSRQLVARVCVQHNQALESKYKWFNKLSNERAMVLLDMSYNLGGIDEFDKTLRYLELGKTTMASAEMLRSKWARQVHSRSIELSQVMKTGKVS